MIAQLSIVVTYTNCKAEPPDKIFEPQLLLKANYAVCFSCFSDNDNNDNVCADCLVQYQLF